jgi:uncharacterized BrkB/YihY/UPF0761 family membrane protein
VGAIYELIGRVVVRSLWWRFGARIRIAGAAALATLGIAGYLAARREPPEG